MNDSIDRQAAIEAMKSISDSICEQQAIDALCELPSAQPETHEERTETHECDLISRQAAIDAMCELMHHWFGGDSKDEIREIKRELENLPSAQPQRTGHWIEDDDEMFVICSECGEKNDYISAYCPDCGARMEGE